MIEEIRIGNFGGISGELLLSPNLNVIIGESGTGKTLLLNSIKFLMGERFPFVTNGTFVELVLKTGNEETFLRREVKEGRSRFFINGMRVPQKKVKELLSHHVIFQSQREELELLKPSFQVQILDKFSGTEELVKSFREKLKRYREKLSELESLKEQENLREREIDILKFQIQEIENVNLQPNEEEELLELKEKLEKIEEIKRIRGKSVHLLYEDEQSALSSVSEVLREFENLELYPEITEKLSAIYYEIESVVSEIEKKLEAPETELSLEEIEERLFQIEKLKRKYGKSYEEIQSFLKKSKERLEKLENLSFEITEVERELAEIKKELREIGKELSLKRRKGAEELKAYLKKEFQNLGLGSARFEVQFEKLSEPSPIGPEKVTFLFSGNPNLPLSPLSSSISGGELSRFLLSVLTVVSISESTMVFDEIDVGMSGVILKKVAEKLKRISDSQQVIAVTHSPQVAAAGDKVFKLEKDEKGNVKIKALNEDQILEELSLMLSGEVTEKGIETAKDLRKNWRERWKR